MGRLDLPDALPDKFFMKRLLPLILAGIFAAVQPLWAQGMSAGGTYAQPGHPASTSHTSSQSLETAKDSAKSNGPVHVSVSVAAEEKGNPATSFSTKTPHLYGSFTTTGTNKGEKIYAVWVNSATKKPLYKTSMVSAEPNFNGNVSIDAPHGWNPGKYELDVYLSNKLQGRATFNMKGN